MYHTINILLVTMIVLGALCTGCTSANNPVPASSEAQQTTALAADSANPYPQHIAGHYKIAPASLQALRLPAVAQGKTIFHLREDSTFRLSYFPMYDFFEDSLSRYDLVNGWGSWDINKIDGEPQWHLDMAFDTIAHATTGKVMATNIVKSNFFRIRHTAPPHDIFMPVRITLTEQIGILLLKK
jgi:hypothetical protein